MLSSVGLSTHIWNNNFRSMVLLVLYPFILLFMFWLISVALAFGTAGNNMTTQNVVATGHDFFLEYWPLALTIALVWFLIAWFSHTKMIRALSHSRPVTRKEEPALYNLLENLCISRGLSMPQLEIIETGARNAFASGINEKTYCITVTRGLLQSLQKDEVEAVLGHELTHIQNKDVRLLIVSIVFTGMVGFAAQLVWSVFRNSLRPSGRNNKGKGQFLLIVGSVLVILWAGYFATIFTRFALSRRREYMADAGSVELTRNPDAMMRALQRIAGMDQMADSSADIALMCIENAKPFFGLFLTHPPIDQRIETIAAMTGSAVPVPVPLDKPFDTVSAPIEPEKNKENWFERKQRLRREARTSKPLSRP